MARQAAAKRAGRRAEPEAPAPRLDTPADVDAFLAQFSADEIAGVLAAMPPAQQSAIAADEARASFMEFVRQAWPYVPQVDPLVEAWHMEALCIHAEAVGRGEIGKLGINVPPGHSKSVLWVVLFPAWVWTWWPEAQFLCGSFAKELAVRDSGRCRVVIESPWYQETFAKPAGWRLRRDLNQKHWFANTKGGERFSMGMGGTGRRAHFIIIDDALNIDKAHSPAERLKCNRWLSQTISQRFIAGQPQRLILVGQRLHEDDPFGWLKTQKGAQFLSLPSEYEPQNPAVTYLDETPANDNRQLGSPRREFWRDPRQDAGDLLFPQLYPREKIEDDKIKLGPFGFAAQHQQRPAPEGGGIFKVDKWRFWTADPAQLERIGLTLGVVDRPKGCSEAPAKHVDLARLDELLISVDATFRETNKGSYVVIDVWGRVGSRRLLIFKVRRRMDFTDTVEALLRVIKMFPRARRKLIEGKANGDAIISTLEKRYHVIGCEPIDPGQSGKLQRAHAMLPYQASGNVELADGAAWMPDHIAEHAAFPNGATDDSVDCESQALQGFEATPSTAQKWANSARR